MQLVVMNNAQLPHSNPGAKYVIYLEVCVIQFVRLSWVFINIFNMFAQESW